jgi:lipopolysaccharide/colanic/teichoic acid biosynthesis glycosyltransferase
MLRLLDIVLSVLGLVTTSPLLIFICAIVYIEEGQPIFRQMRLGRHRQPFALYKFRTMHRGTPETASHLVKSSAITRIGVLLRRSKLDELPQLWNVLRGEMSFVGPRPCLLTQNQLIASRDALGVFKVRPGITGLAQISGIDMSDPDKLVLVEAQMIHGLNLATYLKFIFLTLVGRGGGDRVRS